MAGATDTYGPRGTGEFGFIQDDWIPLEWWDGRLVESWEVTADKIVFKIRPGVYWTGKSINPGVMERREYTVDDFVFNIKGSMAGLMGAEQRELVEDIYAVDNYTAVIETNFFHPEWWLVFFRHAGEHIPPEMVEAGPKDWGNLVGTGPFILEAYVPGSHFSYIRNPDYWRTTTINGVEYPIPFVDRMVFPMIEDISTNVAALRTAMLDMHHRIPPAYGPELAATELMRGEVMTANPLQVFLRTDTPPFDNRDVRRALFIGTDRETIHKAIFADVGVVYSWPLMEGVPGFVPLEELPPETRMLWDYNPVDARQMLRDAGVPEGFKMEMFYRIRPEWEGLAEMIAGMWEEDLGIEVELKVYEEVAFISLLRAMGHTDSALNISVRLPMVPFVGLESYFITGAMYNYSIVDDPYFNETIATARATVDDAERTALLEELFIYVQDEAWAVPLSHPFALTYWWPWVKNYYGETVQVCLEPPLELIWLDLDLKADMGY